MSDDNNNNNRFDPNMNELFGTPLQNQRNQFEQSLKTKVKELQRVQSSLQMAQNEIEIMESVLKIARNKIKLLGEVIDNMKAEICVFKSGFAVNSDEKSALEEPVDFGPIQPRGSSGIISADTIASATDMKQKVHDYIGQQSNPKAQIGTIAMGSRTPKRARDGEFVSFSSGVKGKIEFFNKLSK